MNSWDETRVWKTLLGKSDEPSASSVRSALEQCLPQIQIILASEAAPTDFTLHDAGHSFRVAQRMAEVIPAAVLPKLSSYELALLLLAAYLHDIGMTPERKKVQLHYQYLLTGDPQELSANEIDEFQGWLVEDGTGAVPPLAEGTPSVASLSRARELTTHYCRHRHNDWSEDWIRRNLSQHSLASYANWIDDLVRLCKSHHEDLLSPA